MRHKFESVSQDPRKKVQSYLSHNISYSYRVKNAQTKRMKKIINHSNIDIQILKRNFFALKFSDQIKYSDGFVLYPYLLFMILVSI